MQEQAFLQVRVDKNLKEEAENILDKVGIEMPTAVRMFLKRIVLEGGIPFDTKIPEIAFQEKVVAVESKEKKQEEMKVIHIPAKPAKYVPYSEYIDLLYKVPTDKVTRRLDIENYLMEKYHVERIEFMGSHADEHEWLYAPFWKEISERGFLQESTVCSRDRQEQKLKEEGFQIVPCGAHGKSLKVADYQKHLFHFDTLR